MKDMEAHQPNGHTSVHWIYLLCISIFVFIGLISNILSLQTFLQSSKRNTNIGLYLIVFTVSAIVSLILFEVRATLEFQPNNLSIPTTICNKFASVNIICLHYSFWLSSLVAIERVLIVYEFAHLDDRQPRAIVACIVTVIIVFASEIYAIIDDRPTEFHPINGLYICKLNETNSMKTVDQVLKMIYRLFPVAVHSISSILVLIRFIRHHVDMGNATSRAACLNQFRNHDDFFVPPLVIVLCILPHMIYAHFLTVCADSTQLNLFHLHMALLLLEYMPLLLNFVIYVTLSNIYMNAFYRSPLGKPFQCSQKEQEQSKC